MLNYKKPKNFKTLHIEYLKVIYNDSNKTIFSSLIKRTNVDFIVKLALFHEETYCSRIKKLKLVSMVEYF